MAIDVVWFKRDLRCRDHAPLLSASLSGRPVLCLFMIETQRLKLKDTSPMHINWELDCAVALSKDVKKIGLDIHFHIGDAREILEGIHCKYGIHASSGGGRSRSSRRARGTRRSRNTSRSAPGARAPTLSRPRAAARRRSGRRRRTRAGRPGGRRGRSASQMPHGTPASAATRKSPTAAEAAPTSASSSQ